MLRTDPGAALFSQFHRTAAFMPAADVMVSNGDLLLRFDLPGLTAEDVLIEAQDSFLTVRGERKRAQAPDGASYVQAERPFGAFERRIQIPKGIDPDAITARMQDGVLSLIVPEPERMKPKAIAISARGEEREPAAV